MIVMSCYKRESTWTIVDMIVIHVINVKYMDDSRHDCNSCYKREVHGR